MTENKFANIFIHNDDGNVLYRFVRYGFRSYFDHFIVNNCLQYNFIPTYVMITVSSSVLFYKKKKKLPTERTNSFYIKCFSK